MLVANLEDRAKPVRLGSRTLELGPYEVTRVETLIGPRAKAA